MPWTDVYVYRNNKDLGENYYSTSIVKRYVWEMHVANYYHKNCFASTSYFGLQKKLDTSKYSL